MNDLIKISTDENNNLTVLGRDLHKLLEIKTPYKKWFDRMCEYGFAENTDYVTMDKKVYRVDGAEMPQQQIDHQLTIDMAKEVCMIQRSDKGKVCRRYFIDAEKELRAIKSTVIDSYLIDDPIKRAERWIEEQKEKQQLQITVSQQETVIKEKDEEIKEQAERLMKQRPFIQSIKKLVESNGTVTMEQAAKILREDGIDIGRNRLIDLLRKRGIFTQGGRTPYQKYMNRDLFVVKATLVNKGNADEMIPYTRVTGRGLMFLNKKIREWYGLEDIDDEMD